MKGEIIMATMKKFLMMVLTAACMLGVLAQAQEVSANANIVFNAAEVQLLDGETLIKGYLVNLGDAGATATAASISVIVQDDAGNVFWQDSGDFANVGVYVPAGGSHGHVFHIHNPNCRAYNGTIRWHVDNHIRFS